MSANKPSPASQLQTQLMQYFTQGITESMLAYDELTVEIAPEYLKPICEKLRDNEAFHFDMLLDICGVDYLHYGKTEWCGAESSSSGFDRAVTEASSQIVAWEKPRFASVYHLLSTKYNRRLRIRTFVPSSTMTIDSIVDIWPAANWYEREAFDLFGIIYDGHPDLRRLLTDYGFIGHPFRKDFPLSGHVEVRYDAKCERVVYEPVDIEPRVLVPKVIRQDNRYLHHDYTSNPESKNGGN